MLSQDFIDILSAFSEEKVDYLLVGSYAMAFHGWARATGDIDLWVRPSKENAEKVWRALQKFGAPLRDLDIQDLQLPEMVFQMGVPPNRIDIITAIDGVTEEEVWSRKETVDMYNLTIPLIGKSDLLINKKATGRPKDQVDALWMEGAN